MEPSPLHFVSHTHYYCGGDVVVDTSAAIAPGVVLRAASDGAIRIGPGVCLGAGVVIQAKRGTVFIEAGVSLGTGSLVVGHGHVGKDVCVGPSSTLINPAISPSSIIPPCTLVEGTFSQRTAAAANGSYSDGADHGTSQQPAESSSGFQTPHFDSGPVPSMPMPPRTSPGVEPQTVSPRAVSVPDVEPEQTPAEERTNNNGNSGQSAIAAPDQYVYGRDHLNSLLSALFPHRQPLNNGNSNGQSEKGS